MIEKVFTGQLKEIKMIETKNNDLSKKILTYLRDEKPGEPHTSRQIAKKCRVNIVSTKKRR